MWKPAEMTYAKTKTTHVPVWRLMPLSAVKKEFALIGGVPQMGSAVRAIRALTE